MQSNEFDTYLSLLGKLLRLTDAQRKGLTDELRDHLESRTEDLVAAGISPEAAIHQALDELGDVAGLAHQFLFVSRLQKRRRIMKWSLGTAAVVGTIFCLLTFGRNDRPGAPNGSPLIAQQPAEKGKVVAGDPFAEGPATPAKKTKPNDDLSVDDDSARIEKELMRRTTFDFQGQSLEEIAEDIKTRHKIEIQIDRAALEEAKFDTATRFDKKISGVRLRTALDLLLRDQKLGYQNYDGVLLITTKAKASESLTRKVYPRKGIFAQIDARQVYITIISTIQPGSWMGPGANNGTGALNILPDRIIVANTDAVHRDLEAFWKENDAIASSTDLKNKNDTFTEADAPSLADMHNQSEGGYAGVYAMPTGFNHPIIPPQPVVQPQPNYRPSVSPPQLNPGPANPANFPNDTPLGTPILDGHPQPINAPVPVPSPNATAPLKIPALKNTEPTR